ncbi:MAG: flavin reductase family protein [Acidimicrobiales bacterium]
MDYAPSEGHGLAHDPFKSCTVPRPIGWLSTLSREGVANLAPYSQWQNLTWDPPMVMFAANQSVLGGKKDTVRNAEETGWFVWNMATWELREAVNVSSKATPPEVDEFELAGLEKAPSQESAVPRVRRSPCHFECRYLQTVRLPASTDVATVDLVIGRVERVHVVDSFIGGDGKLDVGRIQPIARLGYYDYTVVESVFEMLPPEASEAELAGLEGRTL